MKINKLAIKIIYSLGIVYLISFIIDVFFFFNNRKNYDGVFHFSYEPKYLIVIKWLMIFIIIIAYLFILKLKRKALYIAIFLNSIFLLLFLYHLVNGIGYKGSIIYNMKLIEITSLLSLLFLLKIFLYNKGSVVNQEVHKEKGIK